MSSIFCEIDNIDHCGYSISGIKQIFYTERSNISEYFNDNDDVIISLIPSKVFEWNRLFIDDQNTEMTQIHEKSILGTKFSRNLIVKIPSMDEFKRQILQNLLYKKLILIFQDNNNLFWIYGLGNGVLLSKVETTTDVSDKGYNGYTIIFNSVQNEMIRKLDFSFVVSTTIDCASLVGVPKLGLTLEKLFSCFLETFHPEIIT